MEEQTNKIYENSGYANEKNDVQQNNEPPKNHMTLAIITTVLNFFVCNPLGLILGGVAIYFANQVSKEYVQGNYSSALSKSKMAKNFSNFSLVFFGLAVGAAISYYIKGK